MKEVIVLSVGGSLVEPDNVDSEFALNLKDFLKKVL